MVRRIIFKIALVVLLLPILMVSDVWAQQTHRVQPGETLSAIAERYNLSVRELRRINNLTSDRIAVNQRLVVSPRPAAPAAASNPRPAAPAAPAVASSPRPAAPAVARPGAASQRSEPRASRRTHRVRSGETLTSIARTANLSVEEIKRINNLQTSRIQVGQRLLLDIAATATPVQAHQVDRSLAPGEEGDGEIVFEEGWAEADRETREPSGLLGRWRTPQDRDTLIRVAAAFLGTPYSFGGNTVRGIDCSAFVRLIYSVFGVQLPRTAREQSHVGQRVDRNDLQAGDLVFFNTRRAFGHVGIYIGDNQFMHASYSRRAVRIDSMDMPYFQKRFVRATRLKDFEEEL